MPVLLLSLGQLASAEAQPTPARRRAPPDLRLEMDPPEKAKAKPKGTPHRKRAIRQRMRDVTVTTTRVDEPVADSAIRKEVLTESKLREKGAKTLGEALQDHPGVIVGSQFYYERGSPTGIQIRGCDPRRLLILVDGRRMIGLSDGIVDASQLSVADARRVEIIKGPASVLYGADALCGVIHLHTNDPPARGYRLLAQGEYGSYGSQQLLLRLGGRPTPAVGFRFGAEYRARDAFDMAPQTPITGGYRTRALLSLGRLDVRPLPKLRLNLRLRYGLEHRQGVLSDPSGRVADTVYDARQIYHRPSATVSAEWRFNATDRITLRTYYQAFLRDSDEDNPDSIARRLRFMRNHQVNVGLFGRVLLGRWNLLTAGFETNYEYLRVDRREVLEDGRELRAAEVDGESVHTEEVFLQDELSPWTWLTAVPGIRYTHHHRFGHHVTPKLSILLDPLRWLRIRLGYGHGFRAPTLKNLYYHFDHSEAGFPFAVLGNPDLKPETADAWSAGLEVRPFRGCLIQVAGFYTLYRDLIQPTEIAWHDEGFFYVTQENVDRSRVYGLELGVQVPLHRYLQVSASYALLYADNLETGKELPNRGRHQVKALLRFHHPRWGTRFTLWLSYHDRVWVDVQNRDYSRGYPLLNAYLEQRVTRGFFAYLRGTNLTNSRRDGANPMDLRPQPGWLLVAGIRISYRTR
ncbi:MAG: TonB-dependent receptor [bacterium]